MHKIQLADDIFFLSVNDRRTHLFENFWPLPYGVTYNSYLIVDEKVCLIDTVERKFTDDYFEQIDSILEGRKVDY
ncbi:MAG TPA: FprA family A-type flavoprotein, partial [Prolixibacteraceae bacterium]|nr:FprA family A-type flavoprotein [Prolixibacteraceae bacterium]